MYEKHFVRYLNVASQYDLWNSAAKKIISLATYTLTDKKLHLYSKKRKTKENHHNMRIPDHSTLFWSSCLQSHFTSINKRTFSAYIKEQLFPIPCYILLVEWLQ